MANRYSGCHGQLEDPTAVSLPAEIMERRSRIHAIVAVFVWRLGTGEV